jgi:transposase-like protein
MAGQPTKYKEEYNEQAYKLCLLGYTDKELADFFNVCEDTINNWKSEHEQFFVSIREGKEIADGNVVESLYKRACGYSHKETKTASFEGKITDEKEYDKHYPPDTKACEVWLRNRQPTKFRDKIEIENKHSGEVKSTLDVTQLKDAVREVINEDDC